MTLSPGARLRLALCLVGAVLAAEVLAVAPDGPSSDHARFDALLRAHVDSAGLVDYAGLSRESAALDAYLASLHFALVCAARSCPPLPAPSVEQYVAAYQPSVRAALGAGQRVKIRWLPYDWSLNERR